MTSYSAKQLPADLPGSGWYQILPAPGPPRVLDRDIQADWIIVGAGFAGLSAARRLDQLFEGQTIIVLDAQRIAWGAAGRNSGFMIDLPHDLQSDDYASAIEEDKKQIRMNRAAITFAEQTALEYGLTSHWSAKGKINAATNGAGMDALRSYASHLSSLDEGHAFLDANEMQSITGIDYYAGGLHTPGCVQIQPAAYIRGLAHGLGQSQRNNIVIYENTAVNALQSGDQTAVVTNNGSVSGGKIILTVNGHLASFGIYQRQLMHIFTYASMTRQLTESEINDLGGEPEWGVTPAHPMGSTIRKTRDNRIVVRNTFTYNPDLQTSESQVEKLGRKHDRSFSNRFPMLDRVSMEYRWGGHLCLSRNSTPVFGELEKNQFVSCCQNGLGTVKGTLGGMLIAELAGGHQNPMINEMLDYDAPVKLPPEPLMSIGARSHLWWTQSRAGKDL